MAGTVTNYNGSTQIWNLNNNLVDTSSLVALEVQVLETKKSPLQTVQTNLTNQKTAYNGFKNNLSSFVTFMKEMSSFKGGDKATTVSQSGFVTATASADAVSGTYSIGVQQLATRHQIAGGSTIPLSSKISSTAATSIQINGKKIDITTDMTYQQLINKVNADSSYYGATMYTVGGRLFMSSTQTGAAGDIELGGDVAVLGSAGLGLLNTGTTGNVIADPTAPILDNNATATIQLNGKNVSITAGMTYNQLVNAVNADPSYGVIMSIDPGNGTFTATGIQSYTDDGGVLSDKLGLFKFNNEMTKAQDAQYYINDAGRTDNSNMLTSSSNTIDGVIPGVTLKLEKVTGPVLDPIAQTYPDPALDITVTVEGSASDPYIEKIKAMVNAFNTATSTLTSYTAEGTYMQAGTIGLETSRAMGNMAMFKSTDGKYLSQYGIQIDKTGKLSVDATKLQEAFKNDPDATKAFFFGSNGIAKTMDTALDKIFGKTGLLTTQLTSIDDQLSDISQKLADIDTVNKAKQEAIVAKYALFEQQMSLLNTQLASIKALTKSNSDDD